MKIGMECIPEAKKPIPKDIQTVAIVLFAVVVGGPKAVATWAWAATAVSQIGAGSSLATAATITAFGWSCP